VESLTSVFAVKKVDDIRLVYNAAEIGLNDAMVVPRFSSMPTIHTHLRAVEEGTHMADLDVGEMFLNVCLHPTTQPWAGHLKRNLQGYPTLERHVETPRRNV
jgi:hypothetical protein